MNTAIERHDLPLADEFAISRGSMAVAETVSVSIDADGTTGIGGAAPSAYYGETAETVEAVLPGLVEAVKEVDASNLQRIERRLAETVGDNPAARAAVSIACWDRHARSLDAPLYRVLGLDPEATPATSFTIGLADLDRMAEKTNAAIADGYDVLKVKVGTERDREVVETVRAAAPDATIRVDANGAWGPHEAVEMTDVLAAHDVEFVEQPVPGADVGDLRFVREQGAIPVAADESCVTAADVPRIGGARAGDAAVADIVVVKLMKCGGVGPALEQIRAAHASGLDVMLGCMIESNASIAAAAHLAPLVEYADLDGSLLLADDAYTGVEMPDGELDLAAVERGTGVERA
ncbi:dipeptide epimerase [Haloarculaceae archaeon H-GB2-1]|nr:dipeptide epimerase [Haloarculaceae archaeon H-GB1-1]MEA5409175.1 dipeptide epimerase [Haloarculaceae archaeon H-GB2-1]